MPAPSNTSFATATELGSLPATVNQTVDDAGTTYTVYYKFTAPLNGTVIGAWAFGDLVTYTPTIKPYVGPAGAPTQILSIAGVNVPIQFPVEVGQEYFLEIIPNGGNPTPADLELNVQVATNDAIEAGDVLVANADIGAPAVVYDPSGDYTVRKFLPDFPVSNAGSQACNLQSGALLINEDAVQEVVFLNAALAEVSRTGYAASGTTASIAIRSNRTLNRIYFLKDVTPCDIQFFDADGVLDAGVITTTGQNNCRALCMNNDATILYMAGTPLAADVRRWDVAGAAFLADWNIGQSDTFTQDILILSDGTILICFTSLINQTTTVERYNAAGVLQNTYDLTALIGSNSAVSRIMYDSADDTHFWAWGHVADGGGFLSRFLKVRVSDGSIITNFLGAEFDDGGVYDYTATATPVARFGNHNCCPALVFPGEVSPPTPGLFVVSEQGDEVFVPFFRTALIGD